jgi:hypothetical protein
MLVGGLIMVMMASGVMYIHKDDDVTPKQQTHSYYQTVNTIPSQEIAMYETD